MVPFDIGGRIGSTAENDVIFLSVKLISEKSVLIERSINVIFS